MSDLEPDVPEKRQKAADRLVRIVLDSAVQQNEQVDVGLRMELSAPVPTDRNEISTERII